MGNSINLNIMPCLLQWAIAARFGKNVPVSTIIHHALHPNCTISDVHSWHLARGWNGFGYHYFIDRHGVIWEGRKHEWEGAHCKENGMNKKSYGICVEGCYTDYKGFGQHTVPGKQLNSLIMLCILLNKPVEYHNRYNKTKDCPGRYFPDQKTLINLINNEKKARTMNQNLLWLSKENLIHGEHNPLHEVNWNDFGIVLKRLKENIKKEIMEDLKNDK